MTPQYLVGAIAGMTPALAALVAEVNRTTNNPVRQKLNTALDALEKSTSGLGDFASLNAAKPTLAEIRTYAQLILNVAAGLPLPFPASLYLQLAVTVVSAALSIIDAVQAQAGA